MAEYIEREALERDLQESYNDLLKIYHGLKYDEEKQICAGQVSTFLECILRVKDAPAADVVEVKRGRWKCVGQVCVDGEYEDTFRCSKCSIPYLRKTRFCPNCGADMREVREDG